MKNTVIAIALLNLFCLASYAQICKLTKLEGVKMNVLYVGVDNPIAVNTQGNSQSKIKVTLDGSGSIEEDPDNPLRYVARVTETGTCKIIVSALVNGSYKEIASEEYKIKNIPDPISTLGGKLMGGNTQPSAIKAQSGVVALLVNFDFDARFNVVSFQMSLYSKGQNYSAVTQGPLFSSAMKSLLDQARPKDVIVIEEIEVKGPDDRVRKIRQIAFTII